MSQNFPLLNFSRQLDICLIQKFAADHGLLLTVPDHVIDETSLWKAFRKV